MPLCRWRLLQKYLGGAMLGAAVLAGVSAAAIPLLDLPTGRMLAVAATLVVVAKLLGLASVVVLGREAFARLRRRVFGVR